MIMWKLQCQLQQQPYQLLLQQPFPQHVIPQSLLLQQPLPQQVFPQSLLLQQPLPQQDIL
jgi:hypothetical protein